MDLKNMLLHHWRSGAIALAMAGLVSACSPQIEGWPEGASGEKINEIEWTIADHELRFAPGTRWLAPGERARLDAFLANFDFRRPTQVYVQSSGGGIPSRLAEQRAETLASVLRARGVQTQDEPLERSPGVRREPLPLDAQSAILQVAFYDITTAGCADWRKPTISDFSNTASSNFGCASQRNLALMVADPRDLQRGRDAGPADGARMGLAVKKYREGQAPILPEKKQGVGTPTVGGQ